MSPHARASAPNRSGQPATVTLKREGAGLRLEWLHGAPREISPARLRLACRCADCVRARIAWGPPRLRGDLRITNAAAVGDYGLNLAFSDGHSRGIYPWSYLIGLSEETAEIA